MEGNKIMVICAHPDDVDFGCAGTMALLSKKNNVCYVICADGSKGNWKGYSKEEVIIIRQEEQRKAAETVGVREVVFLGMDDGELENTKEFRQEIVKAIRRFKPDILFCPDPANYKFDNFYRYHPDHRATALAVFDAIYPAVGNRHFFPHLAEEGYEPHQMKEVYFFGSYEPNVWFDISKTMELKVKALLCHESQMSDTRDVRKFILERHEEEGKKKKMKYAEAFRKLEVPP